MTRLFALVLSLTFMFVTAAWAGPDQQQVVAGALATVERIKTEKNFAQTMAEDYPKARALLIVPSLYKGGFLLGGQYGNGVLLARQKDGSFSPPAFFTIEGGSFGLQLGVENVSIMFLIMNDKALQAVLDSQFKFGADGGITFAVVGAGMGASSSTELKPDILAISLSGVGLYGGLSLEGTVLAPREAWNAAFYGNNVSSRAIILEGAGVNADADRLRDFLAH